MIDKKLKKMSDCTGCYACVSACPTKCITMVDNSEGFWYPEVDYDKCIFCEKCVLSCPVIEKKGKVLLNEPICYAAENTDDNIRLKSSSGGLFHAIASDVLAKKGVVIGAELVDNKLGHSLIDNETDLNRLLGSKYLQSRIGNTFSTIKDYLKTGRFVLFVGTPCQVAGLNKYLNKDYDNLLTLDFVCHGVPSQKVFEKYIKYSEDKFNAQFKKVSFRDKQEGWSKFGMKLYGKEENIFIPKKSDLYLKTFLSDVCLRKSCYDCKFKSVKRESDITLGDLWVINNIVPELDDDKGISLIIVNTEKGAQTFSNINDNVVAKKIDLNKALLFNSAAIKSVKYNHNRDKFFKQIDKYDFDVLVDKYSKKTIKMKIETKLSNKWNKLKKGDK